MHPFEPDLQDTALKISLIIFTINNHKLRMKRKRFILSLFLTFFPHPVSSGSICISRIRKHPAYRYTILAMKAVYRKMSSAPYLVAALFLCIENGCTRYTLPLTLFPHGSCWINSKLMRSAPRHLLTFPSHRLSPSFYSSFGTIITVEKLNRHFFQESVHRGVYI